MSLIADAAAVLAMLGLALAFVGSFVAALFFRTAPPFRSGQPPVTILRPLCGDEPLLEDALDSCCTQDYPAVQIVFGLHDRDDRAMAVVERVRQRFPAADIAVVIDPRRLGTNPKVANLINMLTAARHDVLAISDSDLHLPSDYLARLVGALEQPRVGLVTAPYLGRAACASIASWLGTSAIDYGFLPGFLLARALGRRDCLGSTMMLRRATLDRIGGFGAVANSLAEDNVLGQRIRALGLEVELTPTLPRTTVAETSLRALWSHELRWMRTIRSVAPAGLAFSVVQYPLFWSALMVASAGGTRGAIGYYLAVWMLRGMAVLAVACAERRPTLSTGSLLAILLLPLREILTVLEVAASYGGDGVLWRGRAMTINAGGALADPYPH